MISKNDAIQRLVALDSRIVLWWAHPRREEAPSQKTIRLLITRNANAHCYIYNSCMQMFKVPTEEGDRSGALAMNASVTCGAQVQ